MVPRQMAEARLVTAGYMVVRPNREQPTCKVTKAAVVFILLASVSLILAVTLGGWSKLEGMKPLSFAWSAAYLVIAFYVWRWARGLLPIAAGLAVLLLIVAVVAATGTSGTSWFDRGSPGFGPATTIFGSAGLGSGTLGLLVILIIPVQALLVVVAMRGFGQGWNVELEVPVDEASLRGAASPSGRPRSTARPE